MQLLPALATQRAGISKMQNKMLYVSFNLNEEDFSGLPTYSEMFLKYLAGKRIIVVNIIANTKNGIQFVKKGRGSIVWYDCYLPRFLETYHHDLEKLFADILHKNQISHFIIPDYLCEAYAERLPLKKRGVKKVLFVHLLYRGLMDTLTKEPYFEDHVLSGMTYVSKTAWLEYKAVVTSDVIICNSDFTKRQLEHFYYDVDFSGKDVYAIPLGIDKDSVPFSPSNSGRAAFFGRLDTQKGVWYLIRDFALNTDSYRENPLVVCGDGIIQTPFFKYHHFDHIVEFHGLLPKKRLWEVLSDVQYCVFPSIYEPWGLALTEAMAAGKICLVSSRDSGMLEQIDHDKTGIIFDFEQYSLIQYIEQLNKSDVDFGSMSRAARDSAAQAATHFEKIEQILEG